MWRPPAAGVLGHIEGRRDAPTLATRTPTLRAIEVKKVALVTPAGTVQISAAPV